MKTKQVTVLDHGYVKFVESWGSDERVIEAARMSVDKGFQGWGPECKECNCNMGYDVKQTECHACGAKLVPGDEKLLKYLWDNKHATPFEMAGMTIEVQAPIFVFREWHRHRTQSYNEMSARYTPLPDLSYIPTVSRLMMNAGTSNKQAGTVKGSEALTGQAAVDLMLEEVEFNQAAERFYQKKLKAGVPKELARTHLGVSRYSRMMASTDLRNWLSFLTLRSDMNPGAQWEIRCFANAVADLIRDTFPRTYELFAGGN